MCGDVRRLGVGSLFVGVKESRLVREWVGVRF